jgi:hypothetical protein
MTTVTKETLKLIEAIWSLPESERRLSLIRHLSAKADEKPAVPARGRRTIDQLSGSVEHRPLLHQILASARRMGWDVPVDRPIDVAEMDKALKGSDLTARLALKSTLDRLSLIH